MRLYDLYITKMKLVIWLMINLRFFKSLSFLPDTCTCNYWKKRKWKKRPSYSKSISWTTGFSHCRSTMSTLFPCSMFWDCCSVVDCPVNCLSCSSPSECTQCDDTTYLKMGTCVSDCGLGFYQDSSSRHCTGKVSCQTVDFWLHLTLFYVSPPFALLFLDK